jgi:hypothetical protein
VSRFGSYSLGAAGPTLTAHQRSEWPERTARESESLEFLTRVLKAARLGEAAPLQAARHCRMEDLEWGTRRRCVISDSEFPDALTT